MFQHVDEFNFLIGLGAFMVAQLCYAMAFMHNIVETPGGQGLLISIADAGSGDRATAISSRAACCRSWTKALVLPVTHLCHRHLVHGRAAPPCASDAPSCTASCLVLIGAAFFIASDSLLATNRFLARSTMHLGR